MVFIFIHIRSIFGLCLHLYTTQYVYKCDLSLKKLRLMFLTLEKTVFFTQN